MTLTAPRFGALVVLLVLSAACGGSSPTAPTVTTGPPVVPSPSPPPPPPASNFPAPSGPFRLFVFDREATRPVRDYTRTSRFELYDNGAFALRYASPPGELRGGYTESGGVVVFDWGTPDGPNVWAATGTLEDGVLTVRYNLNMQMTDFEDASYRLVS